MEQLEDSGVSSRPPDFLKILTKPFTESIIQLDEKVLEGWAMNNPEYEEASTILNTNCSSGCLYLFSILGPNGRLIQLQVLHKNMQARI